MSKSRKDIQAMKESGLERNYNQISCESKALVWTLVSFINYYGYQMLLLILICMDDTSIKDKNRRFNFALIFSFVIIPFMFIWNIYGSIMMKSEFFTQLLENSGNNDMTKDLKEAQKKFLKYEEYDTYGTCTLS
jgi:hypothetical protein